MAIWIWASPAAEARTLSVDAVFGDGVVLIYTETPDGIQPRPARKGDSLQDWDVIQTSRQAAVRIRYPDGSLVVVGRDTKFTVQPDQEGTRFNQLDWGQVRAQVEKESGRDPKAPPRFLIRTKAATMGVRGTDFVAGYDAMTGQAELHTIEGSVMIGEKEADVMSWKGMPVTAGHEINVGAGGNGAWAASDFSPEQYKDKIKGEQPELAALADRPGAGGEERQPASLQEQPGAMPTSTASPLVPATAPAEHQESALQLMRFRLGAVSILQSNSASSGIQYTTFAPSWNPSLRMFGDFSVVGHAGGYLVKDGSTGASVPVGKGGGFVDWGGLGQIHLEAGGGLEGLKTDTEGTFVTAFVGGNVVWDFAHSKWIDTLYAGMSTLTVGSYGTGTPMEAYAGIGLHF
jgi:hypothetical protein